MDTPRKTMIFQIAGAFVAWIIGSGFATGQEVLQFFSSYGLASFAIIAINYIGFTLIGYFLIRTGYEHRGVLGFNHFVYFCGNKIGKAYTWLATGTLVLLMPVLLSGAGATAYEYYGLAKPLGSAIIAALILAVYLLGFDRLIKIVSFVGPVIIVFSLSVGFISLIRDWNQLPRLNEQAQFLKNNQPTAHWTLSALTYLGLNLFPGSIYITSLGMTKATLKELRYGVLIGALLLILSIMIMSTAILMNGEVMQTLDIPVLYLAKQISYVLGAVFSLTLILGIFSSCTVILWSICSRFTSLNRRGDALLALSLTIIAYFVSLFPFGKLIGTFYPILGYVGLYFLGRVIYRGMKESV